MLDELVIHGECNGSPAQIRLTFETVQERIVGTTISICAASVNISAPVTFQGIDLQKFALQLSNLSSTDWQSAVLCAFDELVHLRMFSLDAEWRNVLASGQISVFGRLSGINAKDTQRIDVRFENINIDRGELSGWAGQLTGFLA